MLGFPADAAFNWNPFWSRVHPEDRPAFLVEIEKSVIPEVPGAVT